MKLLKDATVTSDTRVLVRCDLDVPLKGGKILNTFRLDHCIPTLNYLLDKGAEITLAGHMGRPKGVVVDALSTKTLKPYFEKKLINNKWELLENLRFDPRERSNDPTLAEILSSSADIYVNECFATSHRGHTSFVGVPSLLPAFAGFRLEEEVTTLGQCLNNPQRPLVAIIGGAKFETKIPAVQKFLSFCDYVLVGGKIARESQFLTWAKNIDSSALHSAQDYAHDGLDIGPRTIADFLKVVSTAKTIIWGGPMGLYEQGYTQGTEEVASAVANSSAFSVIGGGDTIAVGQTLNLLDDFDFVSTGGGAMLDFLANGNLPGLKVLGYV